MSFSLNSAIEAFCNNKKPLCYCEGAKRLRFAGGCDTTLKRSSSLTGELVIRLVSACAFSARDLLVIRLRLDFDVARKLQRVLFIEFDRHDVALTYVFERN